MSFVTSTGVLWAETGPESHSMPTNDEMSSTRGEKKISCINQIVPASSLLLTYLFFILV